MVCSNCVDKLYKWVSVDQHTSTLQNWNSSYLLGQSQPYFFCSLPGWHLLPLQIDVKLYGTPKFTETCNEEILENCVTLLDLAVHKILHNFNIPSDKAVSVELHPN